MSHDDGALIEEVVGWSGHREGAAALLTVLAGREWPRSGTNTKNSTELST